MKKINRIRFVFYFLKVSKTNVLRWTFDGTGHWSGDSEVSMSVNFKTFDFILKN